MTSMACPRFLHRTLSWSVVLGLMTTLMVIAVPTSAGAVPADCASNGVTVTSLNPPTFYIDSAVSPALTAGYAGYTITTSTAHSDLWVKLSDFTGGKLALSASQPSSMPLGALAAGGRAPAFFLLSASGETATAQSHTVTVYSGVPGTASATVLCTTTGGFSGVAETIKAAANKLGAWSGGTSAITISTTNPRLGGVVTVAVEGNTGQIGGGPAQDPQGFYMTPTALSAFPAGAFRLVSTSLLISPDGSAPKQTYADVLHLATSGGTGRDYRATYVFAITGTTSSGTQLYPVQQIASGTQIKHTDTADFPTSIPPIAAVTNPLTVSASVSPTTLPPGGGTATVTQTLSSTANETAQVDQFLAQLPSGATYQPGTATFGGQPVPDPDVSASGVLTFAGPFPASNGTPGVLTYGIAIPGTAGSYSTTAWAVLAGTTIDTTASTSDFVPAQASVTVTGTQAPQSVTFPPLDDARVDEAAPVPAASASSGLAVSYTSATPAVCTVTTDGTITLLAAGTCTITASQAGNDQWQAAADVSRSFEVLPASETPAPQSVTFPPLDDARVDEAAPVPAASASSGLAVSYTSATPSVCTVTTDGTVTLVAVGTCTITASQGGNAHWAPAASVARTFRVLAVPQRIVATAISTQRLGGPAPKLHATASSDLPVSYTTATPNVCVVSGTRVRLVAVGMCDIVASQPGNATYAAAPSVTISFRVRPAPATIPRTAAGTTVGTHPRAVHIPGLPTGTVLSVSPARVAAIRGLATVRIHGSTVRLVADPDFSGIIEIPVTASVNGVRSMIRVTLVVSPNVAPHPRATPLSADATRVTWHRARNAHRYQVVVGGRVVCVTRRLSCVVPQLLGPKQRVIVRSLGGDATRSAVTSARPRVRHHVLLSSVYFTTESAHLTPSDRSTLRRVSRVVVSRGFRHLVLVGHTDSRGSRRYNQRLSARRSLHTQTFLEHLMAGHAPRLQVTWRGERTPGSSNDTAAGRARNRRTDVLVY